MHSRRPRAVLLAAIGVLLLLGPTTRSIAAELDQYGGTTAIKGERTGFFHVEKIDGRYWFITPDGNAFFAVALSHMLSGESDLACDKVYGGDRQAWLTASFTKARQMGCIGEGRFAAE